MNADQKIVKGKTWLILNKPFFGSLVLRLKCQECNTLQHRTAATDGFKLLWDRDFIDSLSVKEVQGLLAHEVMHCASSHHTRRGSREPGKWNEAADHVINLILKQEGLTLPEGGVCDPQYSDMSTEHVYSMLPEPDPEETAQSLAFGVVVDAGSLGESGDTPGQPGTATGQQLSPSQMAETEQEWKIAVQQAANAAKASGKLPGHLAQFVNEVVQPKVPWKDMLRNFCTQPMRGDYSWMRGNRRHLHRGLYLPSNFTEGLGVVVIAIDTSASVSDAELAQFQSELNCILEDTIPERIHVLYVDTQVAGTSEYSPDDLPVRLEFKGRGGTRFEPAFEWVTKNEIAPAVFIYLTDLEASMDIPTPSYPVMWVTTGTQNQDQVPFGTLTNLEVAA